MLPSPSTSLLLEHSIGTPHHAMEEDQMIAPAAQEAQQTTNRQQGNMYSFGGFTPSNQASVGATPSNLLSTGQTPQNMLGMGQTPQSLLGGGGASSSRGPAR